MGGARSFKNGSLAGRVSPRANYDVEGRLVEASIRPHPSPKSGNGNAVGEPQPVFVGIGRGRVLYRVGARAGPLRAGVLGVPLLIERNQVAPSTSNIRRGRRRRRAWRRCRGGALGRFQKSAEPPMGSTPIAPVVDADLVFFNKDRGF